MKEWLILVSEGAVLVINGIALMAIAFGSIQAFLQMCRSMFNRSSAGLDLRDAYLHFARWLIAGLTFQLAADIIETAIAPNWDRIGQVGAIALIRAFLSYFLERDMREAADASDSRTSQVSTSPG